MYMVNPSRAVTHSLKIVLGSMAICALALSSRAALVVNDTWQDADRTDPAAPTYSENGTDADSDTDIESAWYQGGVGGLVPTVGNLSMTNGTSSSSFTTYFTPEASPVTLANAGDMLKLTWVFTPVGVTASGTSQGLRFGLVDTPSATRLSADGAPGAGAYTGYAMFLNMRSGTLGNGNSFALMERNTASGNFLGTSADWAIRTNGATTTTAGYTSGTQYTFVMTLTRNGLGGLDITSSMTGTGLGSTGSLAGAFTDATPNSLVYDTFGIRPSTQAGTATAFDTSLFKVEFIPEPSTLTLAGAGLVLLLTAIRRRR